MRAHARFVLGLGLGLILLPAPAALAQRQMEKLGRGVVAVRSSTSQAYVSWRLLANDPPDVGFNLYRSADGAGPVKLNGTPITNTTDFLDSTANFSLSNAWFVRPVIGGIERDSSAAFGLAVDAPVRQYLPLPLQAVAGGAFPPYDVKFCWVGDLDGDGEYDYVVDRLSTTTAANQYLQAYLRDGTFLWQLDMGYNSTNQYNIEPGASAISIGDKDNVTVYDLDGDGRAEVAVRVARGVVLPDGTTVTGLDDTTQYLAVLDGLTGRELARASIPNLWPADGPLSGRCGIMYGDGVHPSVLFEGENRHGSGAFQRESIAFDYRDGRLTQRWFWTPPPNSNYSWGHQIRIADVNHDGVDDLIEIGSAKSGVDGQPLYDTELLHGDRFQTADLDPDRPGLETYAIQQSNPSLLATALLDASSGQVIKKWYSAIATDVGRGDALDMDPRYRGVEVFSTQPGVFDCKGNQVSATAPFPTLGIWWDADHQREMFSASDGNGYNPVINKWNYATSSAGRVYSVYQEGVHTAYGGRPAMFGDLLGDWREEFVVVANDYSELRIYTTKIPATNRLYCLMQSAAYRCQSTCKGYYQASYTDYYLGEQMQPPQPPPQVAATLVWRGGGGNVWDTSAPNWFTNWALVGNANTNPASFDPGQTALFDLTGSNHTAVMLTGALTPGDVTVYSPKDYTFDGRNGFLTGPMKLVKAGAGKLTLAGTNDFTGTTTVWEGPLVINGSLSGSPVTVRGGVWLDGAIAGNGLVAQGAAVYRGGNVSPGNGVNSPGTLRIVNGLALVDGAFCRFDLSDDPTGTTRTNDLLNVAGTLTLTGTNHIVINRLNTNLPPGSVYPLINYSGALVGGLASFDLAGLPGVPAVLTNPPGQIALVVKSSRAPATISWTGGNNNNAWDLLITTNWLNGGVQDGFAPLDNVRFDSFGTSNLAVNLVGDLNPASVVVDSTANYTLAGSGGIIGPCGLTKSNTGTLTVTAKANRYSGRTVVAGGMLVVPELDAIGFPSPLGNPPGGSTNLVLVGNSTLRVTGESYTDRGLTLNAGTNSIDVSNAADQVTVAGTIVGPGALQKLGAGTLALSVSNSYSGGTIIKSGNVSLGGGNANPYGLGTGLVTLDNGTLTMFSDTASYDHVYWNLFVPANSSGTLYADDRCNLHGSLTGGGTLNLNVYYVRTELDGDWSTFTGQINLGTDNGGGDFRIGNSDGYANASINLADRIAAYHISGAAVALGALSGNALASLSGTPWTVGAKNTDATYAGSIYGNSITKVGNGTWTLTGNTNIYSGGTTINGGTLQIGSGGAAGTLGPGNITDNGTLAFNRSDSINDTGFGIISGVGNLTKRGAGTLALSKSHTFAGATTVEAGTLALTGSGSIASSAKIMIAGGTLLDASGRTDGTMTLASGQTISGNGAVKGNVIVAVGAALAPGASVGTLTFSNALTLTAGSLSLFEITKFPLTNDVARVFGALTYGGVLTVTNISNNLLDAGDAFRLFNAASYAGAFASISLPPLAPGLVWDTSALNTNGTLRVIPAPRIGSLTVAGGYAIIAGTGGPANGIYYVLSSTNVALPAAQWPRLATNQFDSHGNFSFTNAVTPSIPQRFYRLQLP